MHVCVCLCLCVCVSPTGGADPHAEVMSLMASNAAYTGNSASEPSVAMGAGQHLRQHVATVLPIPPSLIERLSIQQHGANAEVGCLLYTRAYTHGRTCTLTLAHICLHTYDYRAIRNCMGSICIYDIAYVSALAVCVCVCVCVMVRTGHQHPAGHHQGQQQAPHQPQNRSKFKFKQVRESNVRHVCEGMSV